MVPLWPASWPLAFSGDKAAAAKHCCCRAHRSIQKTRHTDKALPRQPQSTSFPHTSVRTRAAIVPSLDWLLERVAHDAGNLEDPDQLGERALCTNNAASRFGLRVANGFSG